MMCNFSDNVTFFCFIYCENVIRIELNWIFVGKFTQVTVTFWLGRYATQAESGH